MRVSGPCGWIEAQIGNMNNVKVAEFKSWWIEIVTRIALVGRDIKGMNLYEGRYANVFGDAHDIETVNYLWENKGERLVFVLLQDFGYYRVPAVISREERGCLEFESIAKSEFYGGKPVCQRVLV